jgi:HEPN domain-containing protein
MNIKETDKIYIIWQNRAFDFYVAARMCAQSALFKPAAFMANQAIETMLKATLLYWDNSFVPQDSGHAIKKMLNTLHNKLKGQSIFDIPEYFYFENRYQSVSRYPKHGKGLGVPSTFIEDLDRIFVQLISMVPFQFNSKLVRTLRGEYWNILVILRRSNSQMPQLRKFLGVRLNKKA